MGVTTIDQKSQDKIGKICSALMVDIDDEITLISSRSIIIRMKVREISQTSRSTRGVRLMNLEEGDSVASLARIPAAGLLADDDKENDRENDKEEAKPAAPDQPAESAAPDQPAESAE
jgi:DNA gyrase subunit A